MTSTDFAARYRLLKNVATRGARSFLAQQVALGRMVMVHYLDSETPQQRSATLARLEGLRPPTREKLLEIVDVDGSPVAVTLFISSFVDFSTWLYQVSPASAQPAPSASASPAEPSAGDFTRAFNKIESAGPPPVVAPAFDRPPVREAPPPKSAGEFTRIFGKMDLGGAKAAPTPRVEAVPKSPPADERESPTLIIERQRPAPKQPVTPPAAPAMSSSTASAEAESGFTAIFGRAGAQLPADLPATTPNPAPSAAAAERVMQPVPVPEFDRSSPPAPPPVGAPPQETGEFTQLFQRMSATAPPSASAPPMMPMPAFAPSDASRPIEAAPRADLGPPPLATPSLPAAVLPPATLGAVLGAIAPAVSALPNASRQAPNAATTSPAPWGAPTPAPSPGNMFATAAGQSEFTRILGRVVVPAPPPISIQPPAAAAAPAAPKSNSMLPLIIALSVVILLSVAIVAYFVFRK